MGGFPFGLLKLGALCALGATARLAAQDDTPRPGRVLREVRITTRDVFPAPDADENLFYRLANGLHAVTDPEVVRREVFIRRGDPIDPDLAQELERNLRSMRLFGQVSANLVAVGEDEADLEVHTRDRFSLVAGVSAAFFGGVDTLSATVHESNLLGTGKRLGAQFRESDDERRGILRYSDPQLFGSWHHLDLTAGETEEGTLAHFDLSRPFKHLADPLSYGITAAYRDQRIDYYRSGETIAEIPERRGDGRLFVAAAHGPRHRRDILGAELVARESSFEPATGADALRVRVPSDTTELQLGPYLGFERIESYRQVVGLDTLDFTEDLTMGLSGRLRLAGVLYDQGGIDAEVQALVGVHLRASMEPLAETWVTAELDAAVRFDSRARGWHGSLDLHAFNMSLPRQTFAGNLSFDVGAEHQGLVPQLTVGEDNGLRGYPAREFSGSRILRLNLEDRLHTGLQLLSVHVGLVGFVDAAWIHGPDQGLSMRDGIASAGVGLRLGSSHLAGDGMLSIDFAWPLNRVAGTGYDLSVSVSPGQVFTFFGKRTQLVSEFR